MLHETLREDTHTVRRVLPRTAQTVDALTKKLNAFCRKLYRTFHNYVRFAIDYVSPAVKDADEAETHWIASGTGSVLLCIDGDDPVDAFCQMSPEERLEMLENIMIINARLLRITPPQFKLTDQFPVNLVGSYHLQTHSITLNADLILAQPITAELVKEAILTVIHELFHAYQYVAMFEPKKYGIPAEIAAFWRRSARDYCSFAQNPSYYYLQPFESYARYVAEGVMEVLRDPDMVAEIRSQLDCKGGE